MTSMKGKAKVKHMSKMMINSKTEVTVLKIVRRVTMMKGLKASSKVHSSPNGQDNDA